MSDKSIRIEVSGRVQGVFFRASTKEVCTKYGILGWVRNLPGGSVLIHAEASEETLNRLLTWCQQGPPMANVTNVQIEDVESEDSVSFEILH